MNAEDTRITEYALGELRGAAREEFEKELAASEELQNELREMTAWCERVGRELADPQEGLLDEQRAALREECGKNLRIVRRKFAVQRSVTWGALAALAACLLLAPLIPWMGTTQTEAPDFEARPVIAAISNSAVPSFNVSTVDSPASPPRLATSTDAVAFVAPTTAPASQPQLAMAELKELAKAGEESVNVSQSRFAAANTRQLQDQDMLRAPVLQDLPIAGRLGVAADKKSAVVSSTNESYDSIKENTFLTAKTNPLSTFSIDVDTASYANVRRFLQSEQLPPVDAVRVEEMLNYFPYSYPQPKDGKPFSVKVEASQAPWNPAHKLIRIGLKGREVPQEDRGAANLVFLLDVSGSMEPENRLPLIKRSLAALVKNLSPRDRVAIVVYAGASGLALPSTPGSQKDRILDALDHLQANGSTNGADGIKLAYQIAEQNLLKNGNNRVILCTDGDFNVGVTSKDELIQLIERERASGVFLSVLGVGEGNLKDSTMMNLADKGNGNYAYIDSFAEGRKVLVEQMGGTLFTIAKDVKIQVEFNPAFVEGYRLIGYEKRILAKEDFNDDTKDAGEIGAGHTVTALYEIVPTGQALPGRPTVDALKYQAPSAPAPESTELLTVKLRYKAPTGDKSELIEVPVQAASVVSLDQASPDFHFAAAVAAFGMKLRNSPDVRDFTWKDIQDLARRGLGEDAGSYRAEFLTLVEKAAYLDRRASGEDTAPVR